jgi:hypothetical protein
MVIPNWVPAAIADFILPYIFDVGRSRGFLRKRLTPSLYLMSLFGLTNLVRRGCFRSKVDGFVYWTTACQLRNSQLTQCGLPPPVHVQRRALPRRVAEEAVTPNTQAPPFYRTRSGVRLCWELEEPQGPQGSQLCLMSLVSALSQSIRSHEFGAKRRFPARMLDGFVPRGPSMATYE